MITSFFPLFLFGSFGVAFPSQHDGGLRLLRYDVVGLSLDCVSAFLLPRAVTTRMLGSGFLSLALVLAVCRPE